LKPPVLGGNPRLLKIPPKAKVLSSIDANPLITPRICEKQKSKILFSIFQIDLLKTVTFKETYISQGNEKDSIKREG